MFQALVAAWSAICEATMARQSGQVGTPRLMWPGMTMPSLSEQRMGVQSLVRPRCLATWTTVVWVKVG